MGDRKRYRKYHRSEDAKIPRTTAWRIRKKQKQLLDAAATATTAAAEDSGMLNQSGAVVIQNKQLEKKEK